MQSSRATDTVFAGSIPSIYNRYMVPLLFGPYAEQVAERAQAFQPQRILETAAGTGVVTEALHRALPASHSSRPTHSTSPSTTRASILSSVSSE